jgi:hypothetical protein
MFATNVSTPFSFTNFPKFSKNIHFQIFQKNQKNQKNSKKKKKNNWTSTILLYFSGCKSYDSCLRQMSPPHSHLQNFQNFPKYQNFQNFPKISISKIFQKIKKIPKNQNKKNWTSTILFYFSGF